MKNLAKILLLKILLLGALLLSLNLYAEQNTSQKQSESIDDMDEAWPEDDWSETDDQKIEWHGFLEGARGTRLESSDFNKRSSLQDLRFRLETSYLFSEITLTVKGDAFYDGIPNNADSNRWHARSREFSLQYSFLERFDIKAGRQILTWGTGDYVFLNDLFPKDWQSFFSGRDDEYLKASSDAVKLSSYFDAFNIDIVWTPEFDPDKYINGDYFSFFNPWVGQVIAPKPGFSALTPDNDEWAIRLTKNIGSTELALYGYDGFYKSPKSVTLEGQPTFSELLTWGGSLRIPLADGLFNFEFSHYSSKQDNLGSEPRIPNNQWLALVGYEIEIATRLTGGFQFYLEHTKHYSSLLENSPFPEIENEQNRTVVTSRLTYRNSTDDLTLSLFVFYSPSDLDFYLRPSTSYRINDNWKVSGGVSIFGGKNEHSFFAQFEENNNAWLRMRFSF